MATAKPRPIAGVIRAVPGEVSAEEKAWAKRMLSALAQIRDRSPEFSSQSARSPAPDGSSEVKPKRRKLDDILAPALAEVGYEKVAKLTYRGVWSTPDVEHVLTFETYGVPKVYLRGDAGMRNQGADAFAKQCFERYTSRSILQALSDSGYQDPPWFCSMHFSAGDWFGWRSRGSIDMAGYSEIELARTVADLVRSKLVPCVRDVVSTAAFLNFLERDEEPLPWIRTSGFYRTAIVGYLAAVLGADRSRTRALLLDHTNLLQSWFKGTPLAPEVYIERVLDDAAIAAAQAQT